MNELLPIFPNRVAVLLSSRATGEKIFSQVANLALNGPLLLLDCGNRANPLPIVRQLRQKTNDPYAALQGIHTARAFTCYQVVALLEDAATCHRTLPVLILDMLSTFYDESVSYRESLRLLKQSLKNVEKIHLTAPVVISIRPPPVQYRERYTLVEMLTRIADTLWVDELPLSEQSKQPPLFT